MWALFQKEISGFFSSITGYVVIAVFLLVSGLLIWVFPWAYNIPDSGYASLRPFFELAPWVLLFLIPAITMRSFPPEKKDGTLDLLLTRPISVTQIILAKYLSALFLVVVALLLTSVYYISIILLGDPVGNIDHGATWGSYAGLLLMASAYISVGIFTSVLTDNMIVAFLLALFFCAWLFAAFGFIGNLFPLGNAGSVFIDLGMNAHYLSLSRGVIDSRDLVYFLSIIFLFLFFSRIKLTPKS